MGECRGEREAEKQTVAAGVADSSAWELSPRVTPLICHPEPYGVAQDKLREGSKVPGNMILTLLAMV